MKKRANLFLHWTIERIRKNARSLLLGASVLGAVWNTSPSFGQRPKDLIPQAVESKATAQSSSSASPQSRTGETTDGEIDSKSTVDPRVTRFDNVPQWGSNGLSGLQSRYQTLNVSAEEGGY